MKVMIVIPYFYPRTGGLENYALELSRNIVKRHNIEVTVVCSYWANEKNREEVIDGIKIYRIPYLFKISSTPISPFWYDTIERIVDVEKPDVINGHVPVPFIADAAARVAKKKNIPFILTYQNDLVGSRLIYLLSKLYYPLMGYKTMDISRKIIVSNEYYAKKSEYLKKFLAKVEVVSPGVSKKYDVAESGDIRKKHGIGAEKIVLFVGQINKESRHKGLDYLLQAMGRVNVEVNARLIVIGTGNYVEYYRQMAKSLGIESRVVFTGYVDGDEIVKYYNEADVFVLPSNNRAEGFGMVLIEAQACGTPVIGTSVGGIPSAVVDGETGLLIPPKDVDALAGAILKLLNDDELRKSMGVAGHKRVKETYDWDRSADKFHTIVEKCIR